MTNKNEFTLLQDGKDCLPEWIHGVKNKKQSNIIDKRKSRNHKHVIINEIMKSKMKSLISKSRTPFEKWRTPWLFYQSIMAHWIAISSQSSGVKSAPKGVFGNLWKPPKSAPVVIPCCYIGSQISCDCGIKFCHKKLLWLWDSIL